MRYGLTPAAEADLDAIAIYVAERNPTAAIALLDDFERRWELLATQPYSGRSRHDVAPELRSLVMRSYVAFYKVEDGVVSILRVLHGSQNISADDFEF